MNKLPIRSCIACRQRFEQNRLNRLQCKEGKVVAYNHNGRSFYICNDCVSSPKLIKQLAKVCKGVNTTDLAQTLKEIVH